jgi:hypothetical protein
MRCILKGNLNIHDARTVNKAIRENRVALGAEWHTPCSGCVGIMMPSGFCYLDADMVEEARKEVKSYIKG